MRNTKEEILQTALALFAQRGFDAVSVRDIAAVLGVSQSALYKHYASKRDIFDRIVARMEENDLLRARAFAMPEQRFAEQAEAYRHTALAQIGSYSLAQFRYWTEDDFAAAFRKLLTLEQYRSPAMMTLYQQYLAGGVVDYMEDVFRELPAGRARPPQTARELALAFYAPIYLLIGLYDGAADKAAVTAQAESHIARFISELQK